MKKLISIFCLISMLFASSTVAFANDELPDGCFTYENVDANGETVVTTIYNLEVFGAVAKSDDSENSSLSLDERVALRAKNAVAVQIDNYASIGHDELKWIDAETKNKNVKPYIKADRTMVPLRYIAEEFGADVSFDDNTREVSISLKDKVFKVVIGANTYSVNGEIFELDAPAEITESRTFVPLRVISEAFDMSVTWIENSRIVVITPNNYPWDEENAIEKETLSRFNLLFSPLIRNLLD